MNSRYTRIDMWKARWIMPILFSIFILPNVLHATHIIGGEINYTCLGNEQFEVELTVYRDCFFGADNAFFDDPASIGIFDGNGVLLDELQLPYLNNDTLTPILSDSCLFVPPTVCVHTASYRGEVNLPYSATGYTIVYQRCCRNETITNIIDPLNTGATFTATVSGTSLQECNSGPKFKEFPPLFICVNEPINWDHSAIDNEGDSLVYSLCTPYAGGDIINNQPQPPNPPPYQTIAWKAPFDLSNVLGGPDVLSINANTGLISGTPNIQGQFVVGVCIEEYKDGELISTSRRDFQYNVGECGIVAATIGNDTIQCENQNLNFINTSSNANDFEWYFGDPNNPGLNSELEDPTYFFPDTGVYTITLIAEPNGECADTLVQDILFKNSTLDVDFDLLVLECVDSVLLTVNNMSVDSFLGIQTVLWELSDGQNSDVFNPTFVLEKSQEYTLSLTAFAEDGCSDTEEFSFFANVINSGVVDTFPICPGGSVALNDNPFLGPNVTYTWSPSTGLDDPNSSNPIAAPDATTMYTVSIDDPDLDCSGSFSILVAVQEKNAVILLEDDELVCTNEYTVAAQTDGIVSYEWSQEPGFSTLLSTDPSFTFSESGFQTFYLRTVDEGGCTFTDEVTIQAGALNVALSVDDQACLNQAIVASATNSDPLDVVNINWEPSAAVISGQGTLNAILSPQNIGENLFTATIQNQFGCIQVETYAVNVISDQAISEVDIDINRENCDPSIVTFNTNHINIENYQYEFLNGSEIIPGTSSLTYTFPGVGTYEVILSPQDYVNCEGLDPIAFQIEVPTSFYDTGFESVVTNCGDIIEVNLTDVSIPLAGQTAEVTWTFDNGVTALGQSVTLSIDEGDLYPFEVSLVSDLGCETTYTGALDLSSSNVIDVSFLDADILACNGDPLALNPNGNTEYTYIWTPATGLDDANAVNPIASPSVTTTYTVEVIDSSSGCMVTREVNVEVPAQPLETDFTWEISECIEEAEIQLIDQSIYSASDIISWEWTFSHVDEMLTQQNPSIIIDSSQDIEVTLLVNTEDACQESFTQTISVNVIDLNLPDDETFICHNESIALNPGGDTDYTYTWSPATTLDDPNASNPIATPFGTTTYSVTVTDTATGCISEREVTIVLPEEELITDFSWTFDDCLGTAEIQFIDETAGTAAGIESWEWSFSNNSDILTDQNPSISVSSIQDLEVALTVTTTDGCQSTSTQFIEVDIVDLNLPDDETYLCLGESIELNPNGSDRYTYEWAPADELSTSLGVNPIATPTATTNYAVTVTDNITGCVVEQSFTIIVASEILQAAVEIDILACDSDGQVEIQLLNATSYADAEFTDFAWEINVGDEEFTSDEENPTISFDEASLVSGTFSITTADGCSSEVAFEEMINVIEFEISDPRIIICDSEPTALNPDVDLDLVYVWSPATGLDDSNIPNPMANPDESTTYLVTISNPAEGNCEVTQEVEVIVPEFEVEVDFVAAYINCGNTADVQFTDLTSAIGTDIIAWSWDFGNGMTSDVQNPIVSLDASTMLNANLTVTTLDGCDVELLSPQSLPVDVIVIDEASFNETLNVCMGESIFLNDQPDSQYTYLWAPADNLDDPTSPNPQFINADQTTEFTVIITNISIDTCSIERSVFVNVYDTPSPEINGDGQENICTEQGLLSVDLGVGEMVVWYDDASLTNVISTATELVTTPGQGATYYAMVTNEFGCGSELVSFESTSSALELDPEIATQTLCLDSQTELTALVNSTNSPSTWTWSPESEIDEFLSESTVLVSPEESTTYALVGSNDFGCTSEITFDVEVVDLAGGIDATIQTTDLIIGQPVTLSVTQNENYTYSWSPANLLDDPTSATPTFTLTEEVTFEVEVMDSNGCFAVLAVVVIPEDTACDEPYVFVPNAFTPNGDGLNEQLRVEGNQIAEMYLAVYNRWGEKVFETDNQAETWDGTYKGRKLDPDVFGYIFNCTCLNGDTFSSQGNISLLK